MSNATYYWQDGEKVEITQKHGVLTIETANPETATDAANAAGVGLSSAESVAHGLVRMSVRHMSEGAVEALRRDNVIHRIYHTLGNPHDELIITETIYVQFHDQISDAQIDDILQAEKLQALEKLHRNWLLVKVTDETGANPIRAANRLAERRELVKSAEPNVIRKLRKFNGPIRDPLSHLQWHLNAPQDAVDLVAGAGISADEAWRYTTGSRDIVVCVADDGFDLSHPDLQGDGKVVSKLNVLPDADQINISFNENVTPRAGDYHGTPCAGVALAEANGDGTLGVAPGCAFMPVRFPLTLSDAQLAKLFMRISVHADIVSCSWGFGPANAPMSSFLRDTITQLARTGGRRSKGLVFCVSAGNSNCPIFDPNNQLEYKYLDSLGFERSFTGKINRWIAAHPDVITVSASTSLKTRSAYSSWGKEVTVCAPSDNFDDLARFTPKGLGVFTTDNEGFGPGSDFEPGSRYTPGFGGTSSAAPTVAGVCALMLSANPELSGAQVKELLAQSADKNMIISSETQVNEPGDFKDGFSLWFGHGKVNAAAAAKSAAAFS